MTFVSGFVKLAFNINADKTKIINAKSPTEQITGKQKDSEVRSGRQV
jgi:hypothetical protein